MLVKPGLRIAVLVALLCCSPLAVGADAPLGAKQLAGPPSEFATMRALDPAEAAIHSRSALMPIELTPDKAGGLGWQGVLPLEHGQPRFLLFSGTGTAWQAELLSPNGVAQKASALARDARKTRFGMEETSFPADYFELAGVQPGNWTLKLQAPAGANRSGFVLLEGDAGIELASHQTHRRQLVGERIGLAAMLTAANDDGLESVDGIELGKAAGRIDSAILRVTAPDGSVSTFAMHDDGRHDDGAAGDGVFGGNFRAKIAGQYLAQVEVWGAGRDGQSIVRTAEHVIPVVERSLSLDTSKAIGAHAGHGRMAIAIPVSSSKSAKPGQHFRVYAEVWGQQAKGREVPVAWVSGMVEAADGALSLGFDERWLLLAGASKGFELRNLRIEDPDHFVAVAEAKRIALSLPAPRSKARASAIVIDEAMTMGVRPTATLAKGVGSRLLLIHGYCSGGVWPASQFSNASTFLDVNQNRSNDQFARLIRNFGSTWNSFGTVSHSQGGMASLHLYTYYWSGLDSASGNRLMQSVGTPYRGTNLAGILAALGNWFGAGCGTNDNLTYSGASAWLSGIPSWARAKANYYTTSFRHTNWWTNDYCNFATDMVLSDPEDGTTEQVNGQLSGGVNRGHVTGQCHTSGMRDPAQTLDSSRNATMNSNAAR
jgi:hypothetical protein